MKDNDAKNLPPCEVLKEMIKTKTVHLPSGETKRTTAGISPPEALALYNTVLRLKPEVVVEIGMAQGVSSLSILCALSQTGGRLISIDPYVNWKSAKKAALYAIERAGYSLHHEHIEEESCRALPRLLEQGVCVDLGYIDGSHTFEDTFIEFFYLDRLLSAGGVVGFNDAGWRSVYRVIRFVQTEREYEELNVGLTQNYDARNLLYSVLRRLLRIPRQDRYFRKLTDSL